MSYATDASVDNVLKFILNNKGEFSADSIPDIEGTRIKYSYVLNFIQKLDDEQRDYLNVNSRKLINYISNLQDEKYETILKLLDYVALELPRATLYSSFEKQLVNSQLMQRDFRRQMREKTELLEKYEIKIEKLQTEFIGILSIFSTVVLAFFGGLSILGSSLNNIDKVSKYRISIIVLIIIFGIFNVIFMLLHVVSRVIGQEITTKCNRDIVCKDCDNKVGIFKCLKQRYPIVYWFNSICVILMAFDFTMFIVDKYNIITYIYKLKYDVDYSIVGVIGLKFLIVICIVCIGFFIRNSIKTVIWKGIKKIINHNTIQSKRIEEVSCDENDELLPK
jgi:hypothetical protein